MDIQGTAFDDNLVGTDNPDTISGLGGNDTLDGGGGADELSGGQGNDTYIVDNGADVVRELLGEGSDLVYVSVSYALAAGQEIETLSTRAHGGTDAINLIGNEFVQTIYGNFGANVIDGRGGADVMAGFAGNDLYVVDNAGDQVLEGLGQGNDTVVTSVSYVLSSNQEIETLSTQTHAGTDDLFLTGNQLNNTLIGNAGDNLLNGVGGADVMIGLDGDDTYAIDDAGDLVIDLENQGNDLVLTYLSHTLSNGNQIETLSTVFHQGTNAIDLGGNDYNNTLIGNYGANYLNGNGGVDVMIGLNGNDTYVADNAGDVVEEVAGGGADVLFSFVSYTLAAGQEVETISTAVQGGTAAIDLTGNEYAQTIIGNAGVNVIDGKGGNDTLYGLGGADTFAFTTTLGAGNVDTITDFVAGTDRILLGGATGQPFLALATGALRAGAFVVGAAALDADDYLIYNSTTGALLYDADGNGAGAAVQFATLSAGLALTAGDFLVSGAANVAPAITSGATAQVAENSAASTIVYQVVANDADGDRISYSLTGADAALLTIDASGAVRLIAPADFETKATYSFSVVASDSGVSTSQAVQLTITDVADASGTPTINETAAPNDSTGTAQAIARATLAVGVNPNLPDDDLPSATIVGSLSSNADQDFFSITLQAGEKLILDIDGTTNSLDAFLTLYGPTGVLIGDNDDLITFDPGSNPPFGHNTDSQIIFRAATSGTYYFSVGSFEGTSNGDYQLHVSIGPAATAAQLIAEDVDALVSGAEWNHLNLTFGFPTLASQYPADFDEVSPPSQFEAFNAGQRAATAQLLQLVANVSSLTFTENSANPGQADLRFAESNEPDVAYAYYPSNQGPLDQGGTAWFNHTSFNNPIRGNYAWMGILHEAGHALGLKHGHEFPLAISSDRDSLEYSVMTYRSYPGGDIEGGYHNETFGFPQTLMMYDVAALQKIYGGANYTFNSTDSIYTWNTSTGEMSINGVGQGAPGANRIFLTIWDGGGNDTYDFSNYNDPNKAVTIDLRPGEWVDLDGQLANLGDGHFARGNIANALLFQGDGRSLIENVIGTAVASTIIVNQAVNRITGGSSGDRFIFSSVEDSPFGAADTITNFGISDRIDLSRIDAVASTHVDNAFTFIGTSAFHGVEGEIRYEVIGGHAHIFGDTNGNGVADFALILNNVTSLNGQEFFF